MRDIQCRYCGGMIKLSPEMVRTIDTFIKKYGSDDICVQCQRNFLDLYLKEYEAMKNKNLEELQKYVSMLLNRIKRA